MKPVSREEMKTLDRLASEKYSIPALLLMENAGRATVNLLEAIMQKREILPHRFWIFCGKGSNGGDGLVIARHLWNRGRDVRIILACSPEQFRGETLTNWEIIQKMGVPAGGIEPDSFSAEIKANDVIVDALIGIGLERDVEGPMLSLLGTINESGAKVAAIDIPSGMDADTGQGRPISVKATWTFTMALPKKGFAGEGAQALLGELYVVDIGLPRPLREGLLPQP